MGYRDVAPRQGMVWDLGSPAGWQHNLELEEALGGVCDSGVSAQWEPGPYGGLGRWPQVQGPRSLLSDLQPWASVPALGGWKLPEAGAQNRAHRTCPGTTLPTRAPL